MSYTLAIGNIVEVPIKFSIKFGKVNKAFAFTLTANRLSQEEITAQLKENEFLYREFLLSSNIITDWSGQKLVQDAEGNPAPFCQEALEAMLSVPGVAKLIFEAYQKEAGAKEKN